MKITHSDINKYIEDFVDDENNVSFLLTKESDDFKLSIQGKADSFVVGEMFFNLFVSMPNLVPVFEHSIDYYKRFDSEQKK